MINQVVFRVIFVSGKRGDDAEGASELMGGVEFTTDADKFVTEKTNVVFHYLRGIANWIHCHEHYLHRG